MVEAVQLNAYNVEEVSKWCGAEIRYTSRGLAQGIVLVSDSTPYKFSLALIADAPFIIKKDDGSFESVTAQEFVKYYYNISEKRVF